MQEQKGITVDKLYQLAHARVGLSVVADHLADIVKQGIASQTIPQGIGNMIDAAAELCTEPNTSLIK